MDINVTPEWTLWILLSFCFIYAGETMGYRTATRYCASDHECDMDAGEVCWRLYDGCPKGQCMCDPGGEVHDANGHCKKVKLGGEACTPGDMCIGRLECSGIGKCFCRRGSMTQDRRFCLEADDRLLGNKCNPTNTCYQKRALEYVTDDVYCASTGQCQCVEGFKELDGQCVKWNIGETGCAQTHQCQGGALCLNGRCACPNNYYPYADNTRCAKQGVPTNLQKGDRCNEIDEKSYCALGLICQACDSRSINTCVRYIEYESRTYSTGTSLPVLTLSAMLTMSLAVTVCTLHR